MCVFLGTCFIFYETTQIHVFCIIAVCNAPEAAVAENPIPKSATSAPISHHPSSTPNQHYREIKSRSLRESIDGFIKDLHNSGTSSISIPRLDDTGTSSFAYLGIKFKLEVPDAVGGVGALPDNDTNIFYIQTTFEHSKKAAGISTRIVEWNKALQEIGLGGKLTFRNSKGSYNFALASKDMDPGKFSRREFRHCMEYFLEMSIKLHNIINIHDVKRFEKIRLAHNSGVVGQ